MSAKQILTIGCDLAVDVHDESFSSKASLLDWDIILFKPSIDEFFEYETDYFKGKPSLSETASFQLREDCEHWRREIRQAIDAGKTVVIFLTELQSVYIDTGQRTYSGTGRNQKTTRHVTEYNNYNAIPADLGVVVANGSEMKLSSKNSERISAFWNEFKDMFQYRVILTDGKVPAAIFTRTGGKAVGAIYKSTSSAGTLILLPNLDFCPNDFVTMKEDEQDWTPKAKEFAERFVAGIVNLDIALRSEGGKTPEPKWAKEDAYLLGPERSLRSELLVAELQLEKAQREKEELKEKLRTEGALRALLFEKGKPLENAIIDSLRKLGFAAEPFKESHSEFDVVFESGEGRLIGEAEGKDNKAINIDKLRQLQSNIHEDLLRESVSAPAKPVLFGNAFRLTDPSERGEPFTEKCVTAAMTTNTALVSTTDLFKAVQHFVAYQDQAFAASCRTAMLTSIGRVHFPGTAGFAQNTQTEISIDDE
jgi:hypothetical protein